MRSDEMIPLIHQGQGISVAFARRTSSAYINERRVIELISCMANGEGGHLFIGVDQDGSISGCYPFHGEQTDAHALEANIRRYTSPPLSTHVSVASIEGKEVVAIEVAASRTPIATAWGVYRTRRLNSSGTAECFGMDPAYLFTRYRDANAVDWARIPVAGVTMDDLSPQAFEAARELAQAPEADSVVASLSDDDLLRALGYRNDSIEPFTYGALLLFGTREALQKHLPYHQLVVADVAETKQTTRSSAPLAVMLGDLHKRREKLDPQVHELIVNALMHRDYFLPGPVYVYSDAKRVTVTSPGGLPRGLNPQLVSSASPSFAPRSLSLTTALARLGVATGAGLGLAEVTGSLIKRGLSGLSWAGTYDQSVSVTARKKVVHPELLGLIAASPQELGTNELIVLDLAHAHPGISDDEIARQSGLPMEEVEDIVRDLGTAGLMGAAPVADLPAAAESNEGKVVALVSARGEVSSSDVANALDLSQQQAYRLLKKLVAAGRLTKVGNTRTSRYKFFS